MKARLKLGEHEMRLHLLSVWREEQIYTARERAALACTEAVTEFRDGDVPDVTCRHSSVH
jgi:alkylhydroperoxidase family enzyme